MKVLGNPQFEKRGDLIVNTDSGALSNYKKQKQVYKRLAALEKKMEVIEKYLTKGLLDGITKI